MRVRMKTHISGFRDGEPWPEIGGTIDVPEHEAADLAAAGYAEAVDPEVHDEARPEPEPETTGDADSQGSESDEGDGASEPEDAGSVDPSSVGDDASSGPEVDASGAASVASVGEDASVNLKKLKVPELLAHVRSLGVEVADDATRKQITAALAEHEAKAPADSA